jgi:hypothetical protein
MPAQLFQEHPNQQIGPSDVLGDWGEPRHVMTEAGPVEAPVTEPFHQFGKLFAPGLIPLAVPERTDQAVSRTNKSCDSTKVRRLSVDISMTFGESSKCSSSTPLRYYREDH